MERPPRHGAAARAPLGRLGTARAAYGVLLLAVPDRMAALAGEALPPRARLVVRVLGIRHLLQVALVRQGVERGHQRRAHAAGGAVDLLHACTMVAVAISGHRLRQLAGLDVVVAGTWSATEFLTADHARRADTPEPTPPASPRTPR